VEYLWVQNDLIALRHLPATEISVVYKAFYKFTSYTKVGYRVSLSFVSS